MRECIWCSKEIKRGNFCKPLHRKIYLKFRQGFDIEMFEIKCKPKVSDTKIYKKIRDSLTNTI